MPKRIQKTQGSAHKTTHESSEPLSPKETLSPSARSVGREAVSAVGMVSSLGVTMAVCIALGIFLGKRIDSWLGTSPGFIILGALLGGAAAIKYLYDSAKKRWMTNDEQNR